MFEKCVIANAGETETRWTVYGFQLSVIGKAELS